MADYGLKIWDADGNVMLDTTDRISRLRYSVEVAAGVDGNVDLPDIDGLSSVEFSIALEEGYTKCSHLVSRSGTTISWSAQSGTYYQSADSLIFLFLYT